MGLLQHALDIAVGAVGTKRDRNVGSAAVAPEPTVISNEGGFKHAFGPGRAAAFFAALRLPAAIGMHVEIHDTARDRPGKMGRLYT